MQTKSRAASKIGEEPNQELAIKLCDLV